MTRRFMVLVSLKKISARWVDYRDLHLYKGWIDATDNREEYFDAIFKG